MRIALYDKETLEIKSIRTVKSENKDLFCDRYSSQYGIKFEIDEFARCNDIINIESDSGFNPAIRESGVYTLNIDESYSGNIIFRRIGTGLGDLVMLLSAVQLMKQYARNAKIYVLTLPAYAEILECHPDIERVINEGDPIPEGKVIELGDPCPAAKYESDSKNEYGEYSIIKNRTEIYSIASGLQWKPERPKLYLSEEEKNENLVQHPAIGVAKRTAEIWRDYPHVKSLVKKLKKLANVYVIDIDKPLNMKGIYDIIGLPLRKVTQYIYQVDLMICWDSGPAHIAGALGTPILGLMAPTDGLVRFGIYDNVTLMKIKCDRYPCWYNPCKGFHEYQPCLKNIKVKYILKEVKNILGKRTKT